MADPKDIVVNWDNPNPSVLPWSRIVQGTKYNSDGTPDFGDVSDGYHTFNELYEHRTVLFASLCKLSGEKAWWSNRHSDGSMYDGMFIAGISTDAGTITYHVENTYKDLFKTIPQLDYAPKWDGSTPADGLNYLIKTLLK